VEAGLKYFLLGAFAAAFFVFGMALVYAGRGSIDLPALILQWDTPAQVEGLAAVGGAMIFTALLFKGSLFPFHMWTPDVYQGAPTPVTALMSTGTKTAAFVLMIAAIRFLPVELKPAVPFVAVLTMAAGNFGALRQVDLKRMLAYSGIAHAGYLLVGINSLTAAGGYTGDARIVIRFILFYLVTYVLANLGAFGVIAFLERKDRRAVTLERISGLGRTRPWAAGLLTLFLLSLGGIPPTAGFAGKLLLFSQAIRQGFHLLAAAGLLLSAVSLYYYLKVVVWLYMKPAPEGEEGGLPRPALLTTLPLGLSAAGVLVLGVFWNLLLNALWGVNS
jgi:NADH-quinone oxidoreductase subunit N